MDICFIIDKLKYRFNKKRYYLNTYKPHLCDTLNLKYNANDNKTKIVQILFGISTSYEGISYNKIQKR